MKKHAKKSLLIPILSFIMVVVIAACLYLTQTFLANADNSDTSYNQDDVALLDNLPAFLDGATLIDKKIIEVPNDVPVPKSISVRLHLSTNDIFSGFVVNPDLTTTDYVAWTGEKFVFYEEVNQYKSIILKNDGQTWVGISAYSVSPTENPITFIKIPGSFYSYSGIDFNPDWSESTIDFCVVVTPSYYICFNANGGHYEDGSTNKWISQGEFNYINLPLQVPMWEDSLNEFAGWYTDPVWGERITGDTQVPKFGEIIMVYAHWASSKKPVTIHISTDGYWQQFNYKLIEETTVTNDPSKVIDEGTSWDYTVDNTNPELKAAPFVHNTKYYLSNVVNAQPQRSNDLDAKNKAALSLLITWQVKFFSENNPDNLSLTVYTLIISPTEGFRFENLTLNGGYLSLLDVGEGPSLDTLKISKYNNFHISLGLAVPGYVSIASDNGRLFKCQIQNNNPGGSTDTSQFVTDFLPIFVNSDEYFFYEYGGPYQYSGYSHTAFSSNNSLMDFNEADNASGVSFRIYVTNLRNNENNRIYTFSDNLFSIFDWFDLNSYILGVDVDGQSVPQTFYMNYLPNGYHNIEIKMTDKEADTTVTYKANGGKFADDSDTMTLDARFGEPLPIVETPKAIDNDFVGWFTEPEGGVQADPEHFIWMPWQRETGVTLYAHWAYNPQPVPPEPVPPEPGPTPEPVNPDVPGGGGTAQTGDSMPLAPIAALAVIAALGCGLAIRKEYF